jgi:phage-related protein
VAEPWKGDGYGVFEIVEDFYKETYRAVYCVQFSGAIYVLHSFQKKLPRLETPRHLEIDISIKPWNPAGLRTRRLG